MTATPSELDAILKRRKILITCGTGGVGKTTLSAAMAIRACQIGKRAVVVTIDPAKRLAQTLGLSLPPKDSASGEALTGEPVELTHQLEGIPNTGRLYALIPDTRKSFEKFVQGMAPNRDAAEKVIKNPIFEIFAKEFSGTNEYLALERLLSLHKNPEYDCIILDTPPSRNTLSFLEAPTILSRFLEEKVIRSLVLPSQKLFAVGVKTALGMLESLTGSLFMTQLLEFSQSLLEVQSRFTSSLQRVQSLLSSEEVGFLMVATPTPRSLDEIENFTRHLKTRGLKFEGLVLNKTLGVLRREALSGPRFTQGCQLLDALQHREKEFTETLMKKEIFLCGRLPELARDVHTLKDLLHVSNSFHP